MKGSNILELNEATMIEIVQFWLNAQVICLAPNVTGVKASGDSFSKTFKIILEGPDETRAA